MQMQPTNAVNQRMTPEQFFEIFLEELQEMPALFHYYKFHTSAKSFGFRKNYFLERLRYIDARVKQLQHSKNKPLSIWDCGCGYGTTCLYLAMNGIATFGSTLEFYYPYIAQRKKYWSKYGNAELFSADYADIYENYPVENSVDIVIVQDTLHHLEPIDTAMQIFAKVLKPKGLLLSVEENGDNIVQRLKLYKQRGNKRIITFWDETLQKNITMGNENIRGLAKWQSIFATHGFSIPNEYLSYIRYYYPFMYNATNHDALLQKEKQTTSAVLHQYFFFGLNFVGINNK
jgi:SAM-dependent methyltransferase